MTILELAGSAGRRIAVTIGVRPGARDAGIGDIEAMVDAEKKAKSALAFMERYDPDIVFSVSGTASEAESLGATVENTEQGSQVVTRRPLGDSEDMGRLERRPLAESRLCAAFLDSLTRLAGRVGSRPVAGSLMGPLSVAGHLIGLDRMLVLSVEKPDFVRAVLRVVTERLVEYAGLQAGRGVGFFSVAEPTGSLLSPHAFRELCLPFLRDLFAELNAMNVPHFLHICGDTGRHLRVLAETRAQAVSVDSMVDMAEASRAFGPDMGVCGNISSAGVLLRGTAAEVRDATRSMLEAMAVFANYIPASSCGLGRNTPPENLEAFYETVHGS